MAGDFRKEMTRVEHVVLLGDSIFDNAVYVTPGAPVIEQLREKLSVSQRATLLAIDGSVVASVARQLDEFPPDASHVVVSVGGNDALQASGILSAEAASARSLFSQLAAIQDGFAAEYR